MRLLPFLLLAGCLAPPADTAVSRWSTWTPVPLPDRVLVGECDAQIWAASHRSSYDTGALDPHQEVYDDRGADPFHVHLGWPATDTSRGIAFLWHTGDGTLATQVELTRVGGETVVLEGSSYLHDRRIHEVRVCDSLVPGSVYEYRVGGEGHWSDTFTFTTPEPPGTFDTFRVAMLGDSRGSYEEFGELLAGADAHDPDFILFTGDMVSSGHSQYDWDGWFDAAGDILAETVLVPAHGNAEGLAQNYFAQFVAPNNEEWFSIRYGDLHVVSLNDTVRSMADFDAQAAYLRQTFQEHDDAGWRIAAHHQPIYTTNNTHPGHPTLLDTWAPEYDRAGVDLVLNGHNHFYERSAPIAGGLQASPGQGTVYIVSGGAGAPLYSSYHDDWFRRAVAATEHYLIVDFSAQEMSGTAYDISGNVLDTWSIPR